MIYYELLENGNIGRYTNNIKVAKIQGFYSASQVTEIEPVLYDGKFYLQPEFKTFQQSEGYISALTLSNKKYSLTVLDTEYEKSCNELSLAMGKAQLNNDTELIASLKEDYIALVSEYNKKKAEIENGK